MTMPGRQSPLVVLGGGGHARVLINTLRQRGAEIIGITDPNSDTSTRGPYGLPVLGDDEAVLALNPSEVSLVNGLGALPGSTRRRVLFDRFSQKGYCFASVVHPSAIIADDVQLGQGVQIMAGAVIQPAVVIGSNTIVNTRASIDHDCEIGADVHIAPGVVLSGHIKIGDRVHVGTGAAVIHAISVLPDAVIGVGATVLEDVPAGATLIPARGEIRAR